MIAILNYNVGNVLSILNMFKRNGTEAIITNRIDEIESASKLLLPGVGHFDYCMQQFSKSGLRDIVAKRVIQDAVPLLGICVGHQMLFESSEEGVEKGLGWLKGSVVKFDTNKMSSSLKIPHMGWSDIMVQNKASLFNEIENPRFYMVHSFHAVCNDNLVVGKANYGYDFVTAVEHNNIFGTQFHPEKSHRFGMQLLKNFASI